MSTIYDIYVLTWSLKAPDPSLRGIMERCVYKNRRKSINVEFLKEQIIEKCDNTSNKFSNNEINVMKNKSMVIERNGKEGH